jgi:hypothetical protein
MAFIINYLYDSWQTTLLVKIGLGDSWLNHFIGENEI